MKSENNLKKTKQTNKIKEILSLSKKNNLIIKRKVLDSMSKKNIDDLYNFLTKKK
jgi:hypothetical protein